MSRQALRTVLLDLKRQMRGKRASSYIKKVTDEKPTEDHSGTRKETPRDSDIDHSKGAEKGVEPTKKLAETKVEGPVDFADEMKKFFKKQNTGKKRESPSMPAFTEFATEKKAPKASPATKKKGSE